MPASLPPDPEGTRVLPRIMIGYAPRMARDLEVEQDLVFQRREWLVQRVAWAVLALLLLLGFGGAFGDGPLARRTLRSPDGRLVATVARFERHRSPSAVVLRVRPEQGEGTVAVWMSREFAEHQHFETIHPEPESVTVGQDRMVYEFNVGGADDVVEIAFDSLPEGIGGKRVRLGLVDGPTLAFGQFVFP